MTDRSVINPMVRPRKESPETRRESILSAARALLQEKGYGDIVLDDVARRAGIAKGTLYLHFKDKRDLVSAVMERLGEGLGERLARVPAGGDAAHLRALFEAHLDFVEEHRDFLSRVLSEDPLFSRKGMPLHASFIRHLDALSGRLRGFVRSGLVRRHEPRLGAVFFMSLVRMGLAWKMLSGGRAPLKAQSAELAGLYLRGLGTGRLP